LVAKSERMEGGTKKEKAVSTEDFKNLLRSRGAVRGELVFFMVG
jgi:hypothetical protein